MAQPLSVQMNGRTHSACSFEANRTLLEAESRKGRNSDSEFISAFLRGVCVDVPFALRELRADAAACRSSVGFSASNFHYSARLRARIFFGVSGFE